MRMKAFTRTAIAAVFAISGASAFGQTSMSVSHDFGVDVETVQDSMNSDPTEGPTLQIFPTTPSAPDTPEDDPLYAQRAAACGAAGGHYVVGPICYDREGNVVHM